MKEEMQYDEAMCRCRERLIARQAEDIREKLVKKCVRELQKCKRDSGLMTSPEDSDLKNLWEEICVQIRGEKSVFWPAYEDYLEKLVCRQVERCTPTEQKMLWLQSRAFEEWSDEVLMNETSSEMVFSRDGMPAAFSTRGASEWCLQRLLGAADEYTNARIEKYLY